MELGGRWTIHMLFSLSELLLSYDCVSGHCISFCVHGRLVILTGIPLSLRTTSV